jgi:hypothetical protein
MFRTPSALVLFSASFLTLFIISPLHAGLTIGNGASVTMNDGTIIMNCTDVSIASGGALNVGSGTIEECRDLTVETGSTLTFSSGDIQMNGLFTLNGTATIGSGIITFTEDCSQTNLSGGTGDHDNDGTANDTDPDDDNDIMPDQWEIANSLNFLRDDAAEDADGDGFTNIVEYNRGSDPSDINDYPSSPVIPHLHLLLLGDS